MNITLENFRILANGEKNQGFVQLTRGQNNTLGIDKANNFAYRWWKNGASEAASADNLEVRRQLLKAFEDQGACSGFIENLRTRLGLTANAQTAAILTREELHTIFDDYDRSCRAKATATKCADAIINAYLPQGTPERTQLAWQIDQLRNYYIDQLASTTDKSKTMQISGQLSKDVAELKDVFTNPIRINFERQQQQLKETQAETLRRQAEIRQHLETMEKFEQACAPAEEEMKRSIDSVKGMFKDYPIADKTLVLAIKTAIIPKLGTLFLTEKEKVRKEMVEQRSITAEAANTRLRRKVSDLEHAAMLIITQLAIESEACERLGAKLLGIKVSVMLDEKLAS